MDKIVIKDLEVEGLIGVTDAERSRPQRLLITLELGLDLSHAGRTDTEAATTRYDVVAQLVQQQTKERPRKLIEALAEEIAAAILSRGFAVTVSVEVKKFSVPRSQYVSVQITRSK